MSSPSLIANMCVRSRLTNCGEADAISRQKAMQHTISCPDSTVTGLHLARKSARTICTALCRNTVRGCSPKLCAHRQTERSPSACESVCFGKAAIVRPGAPPTGRHTIQSKNTRVARPRALDSRLTWGAVAPNQKKTRSLQLLQAYWSPVHPYILKDKADLGHFSVQKVFCGFGIVRSNSKQPRSSKITINYRGEILYPLLNI